MRTREEELKEGCKHSFAKICTECIAELKGIQEGKQQALKDVLEFLNKRCVHCLVGNELKAQIEKELGEKKK